MRLQLVLQRRDPGFPVNNPPLHLTLLRLHRRLIRGQPIESLVRAAQRRSEKDDEKKTHDEDREGPPVGLTE